MKSKHAKLTFIMLCLLIGTGYSQAATYYLSSSGRDSYSAEQAQNEQTPWKTLAKLNEMMPLLQPGDVVLFRRGDTFRGTLRVTTSGRPGAPIVFSAYGIGRQPVLDGSVRIKGWNPTGKPQRWQATCADCESVPALYNGNRALPLGRYPNRDAANDGYLTVRQGQGKTGFTGEGLSRSWVGADAVVRGARWILDRSSIVQQNGNKVTLAKTMTYNIPSEAGFFVQNHPATLDQFGEWCYEANKQRITWYTKSANPNRSWVYAAKQKYTLTIENQHDIDIRELTFRRAQRSNIYLINSQRISLTNVTVSQSANDGILVLNSEDIDLTNSTIAENASNGIIANNAKNLKVHSNAFTTNGRVAGRGGNGNGTYSAVVVRGDNIMVSKNTITNTGYVGIDFRGNNIDVFNNKVSRFCLVKDDGGGIYTAAKKGEKRINQRVIGNVILHGGQRENGTSLSMAEGVYLDERTHDVEVAHNTIAYCTGSGINIHNAHHINAHHNVVFDNGVQLLMLSNADMSQKGNFAIRFCNINDNEFVGLAVDQPLVEMISKKDDVRQFGTFDRNRYVQPFLSSGKILVTEQLNTADRQVHDLSLAAWQQFSGQDARSSLSPVFYRTFEVKHTLGENQFTNSTLAGNADEWSSWSRYKNEQLKWQSKGHDNPGSVQLAFASLTGKFNATAVMTGRYKGLTIKADKHYRLRLSAKGTKDGQAVRIILRRSGDPDLKLLAPPRTLYTATQWKDYEFLFTTEASSSSAKLDIELDERDGDLQIDNVVLEPVEVAFASLSDSVRLVYNGSAKKQSLSLAHSYLGTDRRSYTETIMLPPYQSRVLLVRSQNGKNSRQQGGAVSKGQRPTKIAANMKNVQVYPNPVQDRFTLQYEISQPSTVKMTVSDAQGRTVFHQTKTETSGRHTMTVLSDRLPRGWYTIKLVTIDETHAQKLIIQ